VFASVASVLDGGILTDAVPPGALWSALPEVVEPPEGGTWPLAIPVRPHVYDGERPFKSPEFLGFLGLRGAVEDQESHGRVLGPGYVLDDDAEWAAVMVTFGGQSRIARSFLPPADVVRLLRLGLEETARMIEQGEE
jgi:hypothetical protein